MLRATFPAGTLSGAPKPRAMELIDELEPTRRGLYGGVVGYLDFAGDLDMAIAIRTAVIRDGRAYVQAGGGIVADSVPQRSTRRPQQGRGRAARGGDGGRAASTVMRRLTSKRTVLLLVLLTAGVLLVSGSRVWVNGSVDDPVLGASILHGTGSQVARGVLAAALVGAAAVVAAATSGRIVRRLAAAVVVLAGALGAAVIGSVVADPDGALGRLAATGTGRTGDVPAHGSVTLWVWVAALAAVVMTLAGLAALVGAGRWSGLSSRYDAPSAGGAAPGADGAVADTAGATPDAAGPTSEQAVRRSRESAWEQLSRGEDPTAQDRPGS